MSTNSIRINCELCADCGLRIADSVGMSATGNGQVRVRVAEQVPGSLGHLQFTVSMEFGYSEVTICIIRVRFLQPVASIKGSRPSR